MAEGPTVSEGVPGDMERAPEPGWGLGEPGKPARRRVPQRWVSAGSRCGLWACILGRPGYVPTTWKSVFLREDVAKRMEERRRMRNAHATLPKTCAQEAAEGISAEE